MRAVVSTFFALATTACVGSADPGAVCEPDAPTQAARPVIVTPSPGELDLVSETAVMRVVGPDATGETHVATQFEIWRVRRGEPTYRAWSAEVGDAGALLEVRLADGTFDDVTEVNGLIDWTDYAVRARYRMQGAECTGACCGSWTEWSADRGFRVTDGSPFVFDSDRILDANIEIDEPSWSAINAEARPPECVPYTRDYHVGNVIFDGARFDGIGVRSKGGCGSARYLDGKTAFKVHLSWDDPAVAGCPDTRRHRGLKRLTFNNMVQDPSFTRERLAYHFYELMGVPVPRVAHVRVAVNGDPWGLYLNVENIDRRMLSRHFASNRGALYEGTYWCDLLPENVPPNLEPDWCIQAKFSVDECSEPQPGDDPVDYGLIRTLTQQIAALPEGGFYPAIADLIDWDMFLSLWAADSLLSHWDGYAFDIINNWRIYHDPSTGKWTIIPSGVDQTFGEGELNPYRPSGLLAIRCLEEADCRAAFTARLREAVTVFEQANLGALATSIGAQIRDHVAADPRKESSLQDFDDQQQVLQRRIRDRPDEIRAYIASE